MKGKTSIPKKPQFLELFCGTKVMAEAFEAQGFETFTLDSDKRFEPDLCIDILEFKKSMLPRGFRPIVIWASPPCTGFSNMSAGKYWSRKDGFWIGKNDKALYYLAIIYETLSIIRQLKPRYWFIENPVSLLRNLPVLWGYPRETITYCQYGESRRKATDIWTNSDTWIPRLACKAGDPCHERVPHQTHLTGVCRQPNSITRAKLPAELCKEISIACRRGYYEQSH